MKERSNQGNEEPAESGGALQQEDPCRPNTGTTAQTHAQEAKNLIGEGRRDGIGSVSGTEARIRPACVSLRKLQKADGWRGGVGGWGWKEVGVCAAACLRKRPVWEGGKPILHQQRVNKKAAVYLCLKDKYPEWGRRGEEGGRRKGEEGRERRATALCCNKSLAAVHQACSWGPASGPAFLRAC